MGTQESKCQLSIYSEGFKGVFPFPGGFTNTVLSSIHVQPLRTCFCMRSFVRPLMHHFWCLLFPMVHPWPLEIKRHVVFQVLAAMEIITCITYLYTHSCLPADVLHTQELEHVMLSYKWTPTEQKLHVFKELFTCSIYTLHLKTAINGLFSIFWE